MTAYFLGVDIGATKSHALIVDESGRVAGFGKEGSGKRIGDDYSRQIRVLNSITDQAVLMAGIDKAQIAGAGFGISDYDWPSQRDVHMRTIETLGLSGPVDLVNDAMIGLIAGASQGWGIALISGTGCNCWGRDEQHRVGRVTGFGLWMGEAGGASELVYRALQAVGMAWSKSGPPTRLTEAFVQRVGARDADDLIEGLTLERYSLGASAAPLVFEVAKAGDPVAIEAIRWAGHALASMAIGVYHQLEFGSRAFEVVLAGSTFKGGPLLIDALRDKLVATAPGATLVRLDAPPVIGGVLIGMEQAGLEQAAITRARQALRDNPALREL